MASTLLIAALKFSIPALKFSILIIMPVLLTIYFMHKLIKKGQGKKVLYKAPFYVSLTCLLISIIIFVMVVIGLHGSEAESGIILIPAALALILSITVVPLVSLITTIIVYHFKYKKV